MCDRNAKSECILIKLSALVSESICEQITKFHEEILFDSGVFIFKHRRQNISVSNTALPTALSGSDVVMWEPVRRSRDWWWCRLLWAVWGIPTCSSLIKVQKWTASIIEMSCFINSFCQPFATCLATSLLFTRTMLLPAERVRLCSC